MHTFVLPLLQGLLAIVAVLGVGQLGLLAVPQARLCWYWRLAFAGLLGFTIIDFGVQLLVISPWSSAGGLKSLARAFLLLGVMGHIACTRRGSITCICGKIFRADILILVLLGTALSVNLAAAMAPSTRIDEIFYHMLLPKRIVHDGELRFYFAPIEASMTPQMHYQISLSLVHAIGAPEAGNVLSWGCSVLLVMFIGGILTDVTHNARLAQAAAAACLIGESATVLYVTSGPHALGDLALVVAAAGVLFPTTLMPAVGSTCYIILLTVSACVAASTKLSIWPICAILTTSIVWCGSRQDRTAVAHLKNLALAVSVWLLIQGPLLGWTYLQSGSPFGPVFANILSPSRFPPELLNNLEQMRKINQPSLLSVLPYVAIGLTPIFAVSIAWVLCVSFYGRRKNAFVAILLLIQGSLIVWKLPYEFRFLGGLQYVAVIAAVASLCDSNIVHSIRSKSSFFIESLLQPRAWMILAFTLPWLTFQIYYARPFLAVVTGMIPKTVFLDQFLALHNDFTALDKILPPSSTLYVIGRVGNFYAPRPIVLTPLDLRDDGPIYRLTIGDASPLEYVSDGRVLLCRQTVYENEQAVVVAFRTPRRRPKIGVVHVQECVID